MNDDWNMKLQGYDKFLRANSSVQAIPRKPVGLELPRMESQFGNVGAGKITLGEFVRVVNAGTAIGTFDLSPSLILTTAIEYNSPNASVRAFGIPMISWYQGAGTLAANSIWVRTGGSVTLSRYDVTSGFDYSGWNGTQGYFRSAITDTNGTSSQVVTVAVNWVYLDYKNTNNAQEIT